DGVQATEPPRRSGPGAKGEGSRLLLGFRRYGSGRGPSKKSQEKSGALAGSRSATEGRRRDWKQQGHRAIKAASAHRVAYRWFQMNGLEAEAIRGVRNFRGFGSSLNCRHLARAVPG